jgi:polyisoprenoid-binding protein YceI
LVIGQDLGAQAERPSLHRGLDHDDLELLRLDDFVEGFGLITSFVNRGGHCAEDIVQNVSDEKPPLTRVFEGRIVPVAGTWDLDGLHSHAGFAVRHLLTLMRGRFREQSGTIVIAEDPTESTVAVSIAAATVDTTHGQADETIRGAMLLDVENHPTITFASTSVAPSEDGHWTITGDLTIKGIARSVELDTEFLGAVYHPMGGVPKMSFSATTTISRADFGINADFEVPDAKGVLVIGKRLDLQIDVEANLETEIE